MLYQICLHLSMLSWWYYHLTGTYTLKIVYSPETVSRNDKWAKFYGCVVNTEMNTNASLVSTIAYAGIAKIVLKNVYDIPQKEYIYLFSSAEWFNFFLFKNFHKQWWHLPSSV